MTLARLRRTYDAATPSEATERQIANWRSRLKLRTDYEQPKPGRGNKTLFTYENILELAWLKELDGVGVTPSCAVAFAHFFVMECRLENSGGRKLPDFWVTQERDWTHFRRMNIENTLSDIFEYVDIRKSISVLPAKAVKQRVDEYMEQYGT